MQLKAECITPAAVRVSASPDSCEGSLGCRPYDSTPHAQSAKPGASQEWFLGQTCTPVVVLCGTHLTHEEHC